MMMNTTANQLRGRAARATTSLLSQSLSLVLYYVTIFPVIIIFMELLRTSTATEDQKTATKMVFTKPLDIEDRSLVYFEILEPSSLRYMYRSKPAKNFGAIFNQSYSSVELFLGEPLHGCSRALNEQEIRGNSVLFVRGECSFVSKALTAQQAGALFVIIADNDVGSNTIRIEMVHDETDRPVNIPTLLIAGKDGAMIKSELMKQKLETFALMNIPINLTSVPYHKRVHPPWTII